MAYEAMNHAGFMDTNMIVILNDNQQVSCCSSSNALCVDWNNGKLLELILPQPAFLSNLWSGKCNINRISAPSLYLAFA